MKATKKAHWGTFTHICTDSKCRSQVVSLLNHTRGAGSQHILLSLGRGHASSGAHCWPGLQVSSTPAPQGPDQDHLAALLLAS